MNRAAKSGGVGYQLRDQPKNDQRHFVERVVRRSLFGKQLTMGTLIRTGRCWCVWTVLLLMTRHFRFVCLFHWSRGSVG